MSSKSKSEYLWIPELERVPNSIWKFRIGVQHWSPDLHFSSFEITTVGAHDFFSSPKNSLVLLLNVNCLLKITSCSCFVRIFYSLSAGRGAATCGMRARRASFMTGSSSFSVWRLRSPGSYGNPFSHLVGRRSLSSLKAGREFTRHDFSIIIY